MTKSEDVKMKLMVLQAGALENEVSNSISDMGHQHYFEGQPGMSRHLLSFSLLLSIRLATPSTERPSASIGSQP